MTPSQKPEWIEIAEKDNAVFPRRVSKALPVIALAVTASILGIGSIYANPTVESPASALEITAPEVFTTSEITFAPTATSTAESIENPLIETLPTFGEEGDEVLGYEGDDDEDDEVDDDDEDDDEDDEVEGDDDEGDDD